MLEVYDRVLPSRSVPTLVTTQHPGGWRCSASRACSTILRGRVLVRICRRCRRDAEPPRLRSRQQAAARWPSAPTLLPAGARPRPHPLVHVGRGTGGASSTCRGCRSISRICFVFHPLIGVDGDWSAAVILIAHHRPDRVPDPPAGAATPLRVADGRMGLRRGEPPQCRGRAGRWAWAAGSASWWHDHNRRISRRAASASRDIAGGMARCRQGAAHDAAVGRARRRRLVW